MMVALDFGHWRERAGTPSTTGSPGRSPRRSPGRASQRRSALRVVLAPLFSPEVAGAWLLVALAALVLGLLLGLKDEPAADAAAVNRALVQAERSAHPPPACRPEDERFAPC
ncbi:MAG: hypothetical protein U1E53_23250 [Dongiaceae bacterium]